MIWRYFTQSQRILFWSQIWKRELEELLKLHNLHIDHVMTQSELRHLFGAKVAGTVEWNQSPVSTTPKSDGCLPCSSNIPVQVTQFGLVGRSRGMPRPMFWFQPGPKPASPHQLLTLVNGRGNVAANISLCASSRINISNIPPTGLLLSALESCLSKMYCTLSSRHQSLPFHCQTSISRSRYNMFSAKKICKTTGRCMDHRYPLLCTWRYTFVQKQVNGSCIHYVFKLQMIGDTITEYPQSSVLCQWSGSHLICICQEGVIEQYIPPHHYRCLFSNMSDQWILELVNTSHTAVLVLSCFPPIVLNEYQWQQNSVEITEYLNGRSQVSRLSH